VETKTYTIRNVDQKAKTLIIEHPARPGFQLLERKATETTASAYRFEVKLAPGATEKFPPSEHSDGAAVIKAPVQSAELKRINKELEQHGEFKESDFDYSPHATVAYVHPDKADRYVGMKSTEKKGFTVSEIAITDREGKQEIVKLKGEHKWPAGYEKTPKVVGGNKGAGANYSAEQLKALKEKNNIKDEPALQEKPEVDTKARFREVYEKHLRANWNPRDYSYPETQIPEVAAKMTDSIARGGANLDSPAIKATAKELGLAKTKAGLMEYFRTGAVKKPPTPQVESGTQYVLPGFVTSGLSKGEEPHKPEPEKTALEEARSKGSARLEQNKIGDHVLYEGKDHRVDWVNPGGSMRLAINGERINGWISPTSVTPLEKTPKVETIPEGEKKGGELLAQAVYEKLKAGESLGNVTDLNAMAELLLRFHDALAADAVTAENGQRVVKHVQHSVASAHAGGPRQRQVGHLIRRVRSPLTEWIMGVNWAAGLIRWHPHVRRSGEELSLSHLHPFRFDIRFEADRGRPAGIVHIQVGFSCHVFTCDLKNAGAMPELYFDRRETRAFDEERYTWSFRLKGIVTELFGHIRLSGTTVPDLL